MTIKADYELALASLGEHLFAGKWKIAILWYLSEGTRRFSELHHLMKHTSQSVFAIQLHELISAGLIQRELNDKGPIRVEYSLTEIGKKLMPVLDSLSDWSDEYVKCQKRKDISESDFLNLYISDRYKSYAGDFVLVRRKAPR